MQKTVESFELDHDLVIAPYIREAGNFKLKGGGSILKLDVRFKQPNIESLTPEAAHSIEHSLATTLRQVSENVIDISPMGCLTGFYVTVDEAEVPDAKTFRTILLKAIGLALDLDEVPGASRKNCGYAESHNLREAKEELKKFIAADKDLLQVFEGEVY